MRKIENTDNGQLAQLVVGRPQGCITGAVIIIIVFHVS